MQRKKSVGPSFLKKLIAYLGQVESLEHEIQKKLGGLVMPLQ